MAWPAINPSRIGQINQANDVDALFLKVWSGEVLASFEKVCVTQDKHLIRSISSGKSAQFPVVGRIDAGYHTPGNYIEGLDVNHAERVIAIDGLLISHAFLANIDEAMNHYDVRSTYTAEMGRRLAWELDTNVFCEILLAARAAATVSDGDGGTVLTDANFGSATLATQADALCKGIYDAAQSMDEKFVPTEGRFAAFKPNEYYALVQGVQSTGFSAIHQFYGGAGSYSDGKILSIAGIQIVKSNNVPVTDLSAKTYHAVNAATTKWLAWQTGAVGTVKLMDLGIESEYQIERQGTIMVAKLAVGHGILRPECAVEGKTA